MTRDEFILKRKTFDHDLRYLGFVPWGIVFAIELGMLGWFIYLLVLLFQYFATDALLTIVSQMALCLLVLFGGYFADRLWRRKLDKSGLRCPSCRKWLDAPVADTGRCSHCGERVFDI